MKTIVLSFVCFMAFNCLNAQNPEEFPVQEVVLKINRSLENAQSDLKDLQIENAEVSLKTSYSKAGGGGFKIFVKASKKWSVENANTLTFSFEQIKKSDNKFLEMGTIDQQLTNAIIHAADQWKKLQTPITGLSKKNFTVELSFTMKKNTVGGIEFEIFGVGVDVGGELEYSAVHTIKLTFK